MEPRFILDANVGRAVKTFDLNLDMGFSRCIECNAVLSLVDKQSVVGRVPPFVFSTQDRFHECPVCTRLYWRGTH